MQASENLIKAIVATAQVMGTDLSEDAARMMCADLAEYPEPQVMVALQRTRREVKGRISVADVIARIDDGRPGPEEAWSMIPRSEEQTAVWTDEIANAHSAAAPLLALGDEVAARMAFKEAYVRLVTQARAARSPVVWRVSLGWDKAGREPAIARAVDQGRITVDTARRALPSGHFEERDAYRLNAPESVGEIAKRLERSSAMRAALLPSPPEQPEKAP
jgi:hypothetical protein